MGKTFRRNNFDSPGSKKVRDGRPNHASSHCEHNSGCPICEGDRTFKFKDKVPQSEVDFESDINTIIDEQDEDDLGDTWLSELEDTTDCYKCEIGLFCEEHEDISDYTQTGFIVSKIGDVHEYGYDYCTKNTKN